MTASRHRGQRSVNEEGYAIVAAVASIVVFATMALAVMAMARTSVVSGGAMIDHARAVAAADAGIALGLDGIISPDQTARWSLDGRSRQLSFDGAALTIRIEDEQGKIPVNRLDDDLVRRMVAELGLTGERAEIAVDSYLDWIDEDDEPRPHGAEQGYYARQGIAPRNGSLLTVGEIAGIRGWDAQMVARLQPFATVNIGNNPFRPDFASPLAIRVMYGPDSPQAIERERELRGQVTAIDLDSEQSRVGRPLTIVVEARLPGGARARRKAVVELTGAPTRPYVVLAYE